MPFKKLSTETIHQSHWRTYKHDVFEMADGSKGDYYYLETLGNAIVAPVLDDGRLVLVVQHRYLADRSSIEFPCGGIEEGESPTVTAERELIEETGYKTHNLIKAGIFEGMNASLKNTSHLFIANELEKVGEPRNNLHENVEVLIRRPDEFAEMVKRGEIWDGRTLAAWALVKEYIAKVIHN